MINALAARPLPPTEQSPVVLMVSGGSDSMGLLVRAVRGELDLRDGRGPRRIGPQRLCVLHVNHCLRGEASDGDEAFVRQACALLGVPLQVERVAVGKMGGNMEETARHVRYQAAWELAGRLAAQAGVARETARILVAHTADDRMETFFMRAITGAGASGLTGMRAQRGLVVRPLMGETRVQLRHYLEEQGFTWREDATNAEDAALRSYVRNRVVPPVVARNPSAARALGTTLDLLADDDDLLERLAARELESLFVDAGGEALGLDASRLAACEPALARRALRQGLALLLGPEGFREARFEARHVEALRELAMCGEGSRTLPLDVDARVDHGVLVVSAPGARFDDGGLAVQSLPVPGRVRWGDGWVVARLVGVPAARDAMAFARDRALGLSIDEGLSEGRDFVLADAESLGLLGDPEGCLTVGPPTKGERMEPFGMRGHTKLVFDVMADAHVPLRVRPQIPVVRTNGEGYRNATESGVVWVGGIRLDGRAAYRSATRVLVELTFWNPAGGASWGADPCI